jgi:hypothetical protein
MMKRTLLAAAAMAALASGGGSALAQPFVNLTGQFVCVTNCATTAPGALAIVTQNGWEVNLVNEVGMASRAWIDYPGHMWVDRIGEGAIYSVDGNTIQFDRGTVWQRFIPPPPPPPPVRRRHHAIIVPNS